MSSFDIFTDAPGMLRAEASNITLKFDRTGPTTARISWNIPAPAAGCGADTRAYNGIVVTIDNTPTNAKKIPAKGTAYEADNAVNPNIHAGDKLSTALVVGAFYNDVTTTFVDVTNLQDGVPYYVTAFPVDAQLRYYVEGVHAYSQDISNRGTNDTHGEQVVVLNPELSTMGVSGTDSTGLNASTSYTFTIQVGLIPKPQARVDSTDCGPVTPKYTINIDGALAQTYADLVNEINHQLSVVTGAPQSPTAPNAGAYFWNGSTQTLYQWNGSANIPVDVIVQPTPPSIVSTATYWLDTTTNTLKLYDGSTWTLPEVVATPYDPLLPPVGTVWYNGTDAYSWNGTTWCQAVSFIQTEDPALSTTPPTGSFWYNTTNETLYRWNSAVGLWTESTAVQYHIDPNALPTSAYWFNESSNTLYAYNTPAPGWNAQTNVSITENAPSTPAPGKFWYNPAELDLRQWNGTSWVVQDVIPFPEDPTLRSSCDVWWNTATSVLSIWDSLVNSWVVVSALYQQGVDPTLPLPQEIGNVWVNGPVVNVWNGYCFVPVSAIMTLADPRTSITSGDVWHNTTTNAWYERSTTWVQIYPISSDHDPLTLPTGTMWYNTSNNSLNSWNGLSWIVVSVSTTPYAPSVGQLWYNTTTHTLLSWNGSGWVAATSIATVELDCNGNLRFTDNRLGSTSFIELTDGTLFDSITQNFSFHDTKPGVDGASDIPTYEELGIGTNGNNDARRQLQNEIRYELGYPVVDVELTPEQLDYIVDKGLSELRSRSSIPYKRGFFFMQVHAESQVYYLTNKIQGMNKIVDVMGVYRTTSSFLSSAHGAGVYGQIVLQHMYNMGTFDLLSYHIMSEYTKLMEMLFAARITFTWNEQTRQLYLHHRFPMSERMVCIEATTERTEQDLLTDRYVRAWMRRYCLATARLILAETRGKFSTLPGASGSVTLNANELRQASQQEIETCIQEIEDYVVDKPDEYGMGAQFVFG